MALPQLNTPTYELEVPSTGLKVSYRPFLIKEQKVLMIAQEQGGERALLKAVGNIIKDCTMGTIENPEDLPTFDMEYIFLKIRGKSVGDKVELNLLCPDDEKTRVLTEVDLNEIKIEKGESTNVIQLSNDIGITMRYPNVKDVLKFKNYDDTIKVSFDIIKSCTVNIFDKDQVYDEYSEDEINGFLETMNSTQLEMVQQFLESVPKLSHTIKFVNPNTDVENTVVLEGLTNFLG